MEQGDSSPVPGRVMLIFRLSFEYTLSIVPCDRVHRSFISQSYPLLAII